MRDQKIKMLLDTNVLIQAEDNTKIDSHFAELIGAAQEFGISLFLHEGTIDDISQDSNEERRDIILSKVRKYPLLKNIPFPDKSQLEEVYGVIRKRNDDVDVKLLHAVNIRAASFLVTEDKGIQKRAKRAGLEDKVFSVADAKDWIKQTYQSKSITLPHVASLKCHEVDISTQEIFSSLRDDYDGFDDWFYKKCVSEHRECWAVLEDKAIIAIAIRKEETGEVYKEDFTEGTSDANDSDKVLKICTFKVDALGSKIGEHLLKQALWHAYENRFDRIYLTVFVDKQPHLKAFLEEFGFSIKGKNSNSEVIFEKSIVRGDIDLGELDPLTHHKIYYPNYYDGERVKKFFVPVIPDFHLKLFPEYTPLEQKVLFGQHIRESISGNTIRKVYLSRAKSNQISPGDIVFFYMSKEQNYTFSQCVTVVGVVEGITECQTLEELIEVTAKRSVYSHSDLKNMFEVKTTPVKAMDFMIAGHITTDLGIPPDLEYLKMLDIVKGQPQSITSINEDKYKILKKAIKVVHGIGEKNK